MRVIVSVDMEGGGQSIATEATALLGPDLMTLAVKEAVSRFASRGLPIVRARG